MSSTQMASLTRWASLLNIVGPLEGLGQRLGLLHGFEELPNPVRVAHG